MTSQLLPCQSVRPTWFVDYCEICGEPQVFLVGALGLAASCVNCKDQRIAPFTRVSSEVA